MTILEQIAAARTEGEIQIALDRAGMIESTRFLRARWQDAADKRWRELQQEKAKSEQSANNQPGRM